MPFSTNIIAVYIARPAESKSHEFLQIRRRDDAYMGGTWSTVYGSIEPGETAVDAAVRELREETGIRASEFYRLPTSRSFYTEYNDTTYLVPAFCAAVDRETHVLLNNEHSARRWVGRDRTAQDWLWATDRAAIEEIVSEILSPISPAREFLRIHLPA